MFSASMADGVRDSREVQLIEKIAGLLEIPSGELGRIEKGLRPPVGT